MAVIKGKDCLARRRSRDDITSIFEVKIVDHDVDPETTLLSYLRTKLSLTGTKLGCGEGGCGACTVMVSKYDRAQTRIIHHSVVSCLVPVCSLHGCAVTTTQGIGSVKNGLHPVQERLAKSHGTQCGFCSPGMVMSMYTLLRNNPQPSKEDVEMAIQGNLCRCTGYRGILDGFMSFTKEFCEMGEKCCKNQKSDPDVDSPKLFDRAAFKPLDPSQELIFPPELQNSDKYDNENLVFHGDTITWYRATSLQHVLDLKQQYPAAILASGYTKTGFDIRSRNCEAKVVVSVATIPELLEVKRTDKGVRFGAAVTMKNMAKELGQVIKEYPEHKTRSYVAIVDMLKRFAGNQIRNVVTIGGSIMTASATSDLNNMLVAFRAAVEVLSKDDGKRQVPMSPGEFFPSKGKPAIRSDEIILNVFIPMTEKNEYCCSYKQGRRHDAAVAIVNAAMRVTMEDDGDVVKEASIVYGGMGPCTVIARGTMEKIAGKAWDDDLLPDVYPSLCADLPLPAGAEGGKEQYRQTVALGLFFKFYLTVRLQLQNQGQSPESSLLSATTGHSPVPHTSTQTFQEVIPGQLSDDPVGRPMVHMSALQHTTGETHYICDMPKIEGELFFAFVVSTKAHANILNVDTKLALASPGVRSYVDVKDVPGSNMWGPLVQDEPLFADGKVSCQGQAIGAILADTKEQAQRAAKLVQVQYEDLEPILTIQEAINAGSFQEQPKVLFTGDIDAGFEQSDHVIEGEYHVGGQVHFHMETMSTLAIPQCGIDEMELFSSAQWQDLTQTTVASVLGVQKNRITVRSKRLGGGYGGKLVRPAFYDACTAVAANKMGVPVRCVLDREEDFVMTGTRHPVFAKYKVGFTKEGKVIALDVDAYLNAGMSADFSTWVRDYVMFRITNGYRVPNLRVTGHVCTTNTSSNTGFRGFGTPQAALIAEAWITHIAATLGLSPEKVRATNLMQEGDTTFYGNDLSPNHLQKCWDTVVTQSDYHARKDNVAQFNRENRWTKRGISITPHLYPVSYHLAFLNQAGALVHIYHDGSVLVAHGGIELGQGLYTKLIQVTSRALSIPTSKIHIAETGTNTVPNAIATGASSSSDIFGMAIVFACEKLLKRLEPVKEANPGGCWEDWVKAAFLQRIELSATGFYKMYGDVPDPSKSIPLGYYSFGTACSEVEIDCLTGHHQVLRTDIVIDVGQSLNPAIDVGQIEGAFVQGYGMMMLEEIEISPSGYRYSRGPGTYTVPMAGNIPGEFNVTLLKGSSNKKAVYSSKGVGEPALILATSVLNAAKEAIMAARADADHHGNFQLDSPATPERIRLACEDQFTKMIPTQAAGSYTPWCVDI